MSAIQFPSEATYRAHAGRPVDARSLAVRTAVRGYCHQRQYAAAVTGRAVLSALTQIANGQTRDIAIKHGCDLADRLSAGGAA